VSFSKPKIRPIAPRTRRILLWTAVTVLAYFIYVYGISSNPPGFYLDESGLAYNAYLVSMTGAGEFGPRFPLYFQLYTGGFTQYSNPTQIYLLAVLFWIVGPGILIARLCAAACVFGACLLLGTLAARVAERRLIGVIVGAAALLTPWLFEVGRLVLETFFYPMAIVLFLWAVFLAQKKEVWSWGNVFAVAMSLTLLTYSYTIGRLLGPLLAFGLIVFVSNRKRLISVLKTWIIFGLTLVPAFIYRLQHPDISTRFYLISYIKPDSKWSDIIPRFLSRFFQDLNPVTMLYRGDINPRHHIPDAYGSFFIAAFVLAIIGMIVIFVRHRHDRWWWFIVFGLFASVVPGSLTVDPFHTLRMIAYPVFLLMLSVPALEWLLEKSSADANPASQSDRGFFSLKNRRMLASAIIILGIVEASFFHSRYYRLGPKRGYVFDTAYKTLYDDAVSGPERPIYLVDATWGPAYMHSFWYATLEGRGTDEFVHMDYGKRPPSGSIVISSEQNCSNCEMIRKEGIYLIYRQK